MRSAFVDVDVTERTTKIQEQVESAARNLGGHLANYPELLAEITNLVFEPKEYYPITLKFNLDKNLFQNNKSYNFDVKQFIKLKNKYLPFGGERFTINQ